MHVNYYVVTSWYVLTHFRVDRKEGYDVPKGSQSGKDLEITQMEIKIQI